MKVSKKILPLMLVPFVLASCFGGKSVLSGSNAKMVETQKPTLFIDWSTWMKPGKLHCADKKEITVVERQEQSLKIVFNGATYNLQRQPTTNGSFRYEDGKHGLRFLLLPKKVSLFNTKTNRRLADECRHV